MAYTSTYLQWLASPTTASLAPDAALHYITTTTSISEPAAILKHLAAQAKQIEKKEEKVLHVVAADDALCLETSTTFLFKTGGGTWLPGIDGNLLDERLVNLPLTHVVNFNSEGKIRQVRLYWDQATLLKQVEAIGKSGRNWPIRDGKAQTDVIAASVKAGGAQPSSSSKSSQPAPTTPAVPQTADIPIRGGHSKRESVSVTRDPHASLALFAERDANEDRSYAGPRHAPRESAKPPPREYGELFAGEENVAPIGSPLKAGAGKNFSEIRLFKEDEPAAEPASPERKRTYDQKYQHFAFGDGEDAPEPTARTAARSQTRAMATFSFEDFATPAKHQPKTRRDDERHWGAGIDQDDPTGSPPKRPIVHAARPDAQTHFELMDASPMPNPAQKAKSLQRQKGLGLYHDPVMEDDRVDEQESHPPPPTTTTNVDNSRRGKDFSAQYTMTDDSPSQPSASQSNATSKPLPSKKNARSDMDAHWSFESPTVSHQKIYKTAGDGMGSRAGARSWGIGDDSDPEVEAERNTTKPARGRRGREEADELDF